MGRGPGIDMRRAGGLLTKAKYMVAYVAHALREPKTHARARLFAGYYSTSCPVINKHFVLAPALRKQELDSESNGCFR